MDDLITEFIAETTDSLGMLDSELVRLEQNPEDTEILSNIFRIVHTIKGTCGFLGLPRLERVAHASENVLGKIRDKELAASAEAITLVLESLDQIKALVEHLAAHAKEPDGEDSDLIARLNHFAETGSVGSSVSAPAASAETTSNPFPHFCGDDDDAELAAMAAAQKAREAAEKVAEASAAMEQTAPAATKPAAPPTKPPAAKPAEAKAPAGDAGDDKKDGGAGANQSIRVSLDVLENLMQMVSELVLTRNQLLQISRSNENKDFQTPLQQLSHITSELQEGVMKTRMQPIGNAWAKFPRLIRDLSHELNKKIELKMFGAETELDRQLLEMIKDPLTHMVRNSCDHGLERTEDRVTNGKPEVGTVTLSAYHEGGHIIIDIIDDGKGINIARVKEKAVSNGLISQTEIDTLSDQQIAQFIFRAGFSTAEAVTAVSGRGVGMDVVRTNIEKIGGTIELSSEPGKGSRFSIKIPLTLAIVSVLIVEARGEKFAIPQLNVVELVRVAPGSDYAIETINNAMVMRLRDKLLPLSVLSTTLGIGEHDLSMLEKEMFIAVCRVGGTDFGVVVDRVYDTEEIVVKPVAEILKDIPLYSGNTILGDGTVIMILDPNGLAKTVAEHETGKKGDTVGQNIDLLSPSERKVSFLLFSTGEHAPRAVPLEMVSRLEEIEVSTIEFAGQQRVVQYRGDLMKLVNVSNTLVVPETGVVQVIVFTYDRQVLGLMVKEILDIVQAPFDVKTTTQEKYCLGSMVIEGKTTDVVDVGYLLSDFAGMATPKEVQKAAPCKLLLVEDSPFFRSLTVPFLEAAGHEVVAAESGTEALQMLKAKTFDAIVTDIEMPMMNGYEFAATCRTMPELQEMPILAYTASMGDDVKQRCEKSGMQDCILKTDRPGLLLAVARCMAGHDKKKAA